MTFKLEFDTGNDAFYQAPHAEVSGILRGVAQKVILGMRSGPIYDTSGNKVGHWKLDHEDKDEEEPEGDDYYGSPAHQEMGDEWYYRDCPGAW